MTKAVLNAGVPLYASTFVTNDIVVVGGGGGQGAHGVANKIVAYKLHNNGKLDQVDEIVLPKNSDTVTSIASCDQKTVWIGANVPQSNKKIKHLRKLVVDDKSGKFTTDKEESFDLFKATDISVYQRTTSASGSMVAATNSSVPATVCVISTAQKDVARMTFNSELVGAALADYDEKEHKFVAAVSESSIEVRVISKPEVEWAALPAPANHRWSRVESVGPAQFVAASTVGARTGAYLTLFSVHDDSKIKVDRTIKVPGFKGVTALASSGQFVAVASPAGDVCLYNVGSGKLIQKLRGVHSLPVTSLAVSPSGSSVVSTSLDGSMVVFTSLRARSATLGWLSLFATVVAFLALLYSYISTHHMDAHPAPAPTSTHHSTHNPGFVVGNLHAGHGMGHGPAIQSSLPLKGETRSEHQVERPNSEEPQVPPPQASEHHATEFEEIHSHQSAEPLTHYESEPAGSSAVHPELPAEHPDATDEPTSTVKTEATIQPDVAVQPEVTEPDPTADAAEQAKPQPAEFGEAVPSEPVEQASGQAQNTHFESDVREQSSTTEHVYAAPAENAKPQAAEPADAQPADSAEPIVEESTQNVESEPAPAAEVVVEHLDV